MTERFVDYSGTSLILPRKGRWFGASLSEKDDILLMSLFNRITPIFAALMSSIVLAGEVPAPASGNFGSRERAELERVSETLNAIHTLQGRFAQIGPEGQLDQGRFYIDKPGRMRFEYAAPNPTLIVSDGRWVAVENRTLHTTDRYALWTTPLNLILGDDVDLRDNSDIVGVEQVNNELVVQARAHSGHTNGNITLVFSEPDLSLKQWTVRDAQGLLTTVSISDVKKDLAIDPGLFTIVNQADSGK
ncbi:MAG TPA: outer membrane lipoprotein carrier protein LolA [Rhizomicrobium sp.]